MRAERLQRKNEKKIGRDLWWQCWTSSWALDGNTDWTQVSNLTPLQVTVLTAEGTQWVEGLKREGYRAVIEALINRKLPIQKFGRDALEAMQQRLSGPRTRGGNWSATVIPQDLRKATAKGVHLGAAQEKSDSGSSSSSSATRPRAMTPELRPEALDIPAAELSTPLSSDSSLSSVSSLSSSSPPPPPPPAPSLPPPPPPPPPSSSSSSSSSSPSLGSLSSLSSLDSSKLSSHSTLLSDSERNALLEIVRIIFTDDYSTAFDVNKILIPAWMDFEASSFPTLPTLPVRMFLLLGTEM